MQNRVRAFILAPLHPDITKGAVIRKKVDDVTQKFKNKPVVATKRTGRFCVTSLNIPLLSDTSNWGVAWGSWYAMSVSAVPAPEGMVYQTGIKFTSTGCEIWIGGTKVSSLSKTGNTSQKPHKHYTNTTQTLYKHHTYTTQTLH